MRKDIERQIEKIYKEVFKKIYSKKTLSKLISSKEDIKKQMLSLTNSDAYNKFAKKFSEELTKKGLSVKRGLWRKYFKAAKELKHGVFEKTYTEFQHNQFVKAMIHNFKMIKSIPRKVVEVSQQTYMSILRKQVIEGSLPRGSFEKELQKQGAKNAKLIARTERAKLQTTIMENRSRSLGSIMYVWLSSNDARTRKSHKNMNGVIVFWRDNDNEKPNLDKMFGNAGEFPNCRCSPKPILDERDITKSIYRVYDYRSKKIVQLSKFQLLECLKIGKLI